MTEAYGTTDFQLGLIVLVLSRMEGKLQTNMNISNTLGDLARNNAPGVHNVNLRRSRVGLMGEDVRISKVCVYHMFCKEYHAAIQLL